jgi:sugar O-acyltransferase (sialic acid O-acetyltransferase NeuD family)
MNPVWRYCVSIEITFPLINPNEPEALLATLYVNEGQPIAVGDLLCTLETTKSTADVHAEGAGFVVGLQASEGETIKAGDLLAYLADSPDWVPPKRDAVSQKGSTQPEISEGELPSGLRITQPALRLAQGHDFDLKQLPIGPMVTESAVRSLLEESTQAELSIPESDFDPTAIIIYGAGGHGKACLDMLRSLGTYRVVGFLDDGFPAGEEIMGLPVLGGGEWLTELKSQGVRLAVNAVGGIGNVAIRIKVFNQLAETGFVCPALVHPTAFIEASATLSPGVQVFPHAYVGSEVSVGFGSIINTGAIVSHDCDLGAVVNISPGAILAGEVKIGDHALVGMGATVNLQAQIGAGARIGNGATVKSDVPENGIVQAGGVWPR